MDAENIHNYVNLVSEIIKNGFAYESDGSIYLNINKFDENLYAKLEHWSVNDVKNDNKINNTDLTLWKASKTGELFWESPFGKGRPGWL